MATVKDRTLRRKASVRRSVKAAANGRQRLSVHRSGKHIYAQVIDDVKGVTLASASSLEKDMRAKQDQAKSDAAPAADDIPNPPAEAGTAPVAAAAVPANAQASSIPLPVRKPKQ